MSKLKLVKRGFFRLSMVAAWLVAASIGPIPLAQAGSVRSPLAALDTPPISSQTKNLWAGRFSAARDQESGVFSNSRPGPVTPLSARAEVTGTYGSTSCTGTCDATNGDCGCLLFSGHLASNTSTGQIETAINLNLDDCSPSPNGAVCCPADGAAIAFNPRDTIELDVLLAGSYCSISTPGGSLIVTVNANYLAAGGKGRYANAGGTGSSQISGVINGPAAFGWINANGNVQPNP
ncbi:MAG: hypothetical protein IVW54_07195 [Candidatus Binataceae bacterium]|nr:hypothetical protein [Candidatus Binataceae bacterium]